MKIDTAKEVLIRRQAHLLTRFKHSDKKPNYDEREYQAISCVLMEIRKLEAEVAELKKPEAGHGNDRNNWNT